MIRDRVMLEGYDIPTYFNFTAATNSDACSGMPNFQHLNFVNGYRFRDKIQ